MKKNIFLSLIFCFAYFLTFSQSFTLHSKDIAGQVASEQVFNAFGCTGGNVSPELSWSNAPEGTKSFAITMYDPDAPTGSGWWHWVVFDIPSNVSSIEKNAGNVEKKLLPASAIQSLTDFGSTGYGGPCPPPGHGIHQYIFTVYALKTDKLGLDAKANPALVGYNLNFNTLAKASIVVYYKR